MTVETSSGVLPERAWRPLAEAHGARVSAWTQPYLDRRSRGVAHPVDDFLWTYYSYRPKALLTWHPGWGVALAGDVDEVAAVRGYVVAGDRAFIDPDLPRGYTVGDVVTFDDEGDMIILGRAKRFAKIGGEMISLAAVESLATGVWPQSQHVVVAVADERKGEQLVLVTDHAGADRAELIAAARREGMTELAVPRSILAVAAIPVLGSGKVDLAATQRLVQDHRATS